MRAATETTCSHTFPLPEYDYERYDPAGSSWLLGPETAGVRDGVWHCPHDPVDGRDKCLFHLSPVDRPDNVDETAAFLAILRGEETDGESPPYPRYTQFIDAEFESLDLRERRVRAVDNSLVDLSHATVHGVDARNADVNQRLRVSHAEFVGPTTFDHARFAKRTDLRGASFDAPTSFVGVVFADYLGIKMARFRDVSFYYAVFDYYLSASGVVFEGEADFRAAEFGDYARFVRDEFRGPVDFGLATFADDAEFTDATFAAPANFDRCIVDRDLILDGFEAPFDSQFTVENAEIDTLSLRLADDFDGCVSVAESTVGGGEVTLPQGSDSVVDFHRATVGDVSITTQGSGNALDSVRFLRTSFDGFDFEDGDDVDLPDADWTIHEVSGSVPGDAAETTPAALCQTYLNAKNGADQSGNSTAAGAFFYREMAHRRRDYARRIRSAEDVPTAIRWFGKWGRNAVVGATTGYGERADRVVLSSVAVVACFAAVYGFVLQTLGPDAGPIDYLVLSAQSFVTFILGAQPEQTTTLSEAVGVLEGFLGAFLVALFVFTFTRRIHR